MKDFDVKALGGAKLPEGVKITKQLTRQVDNKEASIFIGKDKEGNKVRYAVIDGQAKELVATETTGKNTYTTKDEFEAELMNTYGMSSKEFAKKGIVVEYKHGKLTFTNIKSGERIPDEVLAMQKENHAKDVAEATAKAAAQAIEDTSTGRFVQVKEDIANELNRIETPDFVENWDDQIKAAVAKARKPKGMQGNKGVGPEITVIGDKTAKARKDAAIKARNERLDKTYPKELALNDTRIGHVSGDTYLMTPPKPQGNGKREPAFGYDIYNKVKVGNKEIFLRNNLTAEERQKIVDAELAKQKEAEQVKKSTEQMQAKRKAITDKGMEAGRLVGITPDRVLDNISKNVKELNSNTVKTYLDGYKRATGSRAGKNFFHQLWKTGHDGKNEAQWKREKLDIMNKILSDISKTKNANTVTFEKTIYKAGKPQKVQLTLASVMKELTQAKANLQKGIPADEAVRDVERIMSRFGYGDANA